MDAVPGGALVSRPPERVKKRGIDLSVGVAGVPLSPATMVVGSAEKEPGKRVKAQDSGVRAGDRGGDSTEPADAVGGGLKSRPSLDRDKAAPPAAARDMKERAPERLRNVLPEVDLDLDEA